MTHTLEHGDGIPHHASVSVYHPFSQQHINIDEKIAPLIELLWELNLDTFECCQDQGEGWARISFYDTRHVELLLSVARKQYDVSARGFYRSKDVDKGKDEYCLVFLQVAFPSADIPCLVQRFTEVVRSYKKMKSGEAGSTG